MLHCCFLHSIMPKICGNCDRNCFIQFTNISHNCITTDTVGSCFLNSCSSEAGAIRRIGGDGAISMPLLSDALRRSSLRDQHPNAATIREACSVVFHRILWGIGPRVETRSAFHIRQVRAGFEPMEIADRDVAILRSSRDASCVTTEQIKDRWIELRPSD